ncbi:MAG: GNAT family N-acetyltransferase [Peptostreptococcaceae bacterium]
MDFQVLETDRLYLRKITEVDVNDIYEYMSNDRVTRYLNDISLGICKKKSILVAK